MTSTVLTHEYTPVGAALDLFHYRGPEIVLSGPAGTGKSRACLEKIHALMLMNPGARGLIVRKTATSLTSTALVTFREHVIPEALKAHLVKWYGGSAQEAAQYRYANGSTITVGGMDKATRIMSSEYDAIYVQEGIELSEDDWEALTTRLRHGRVSFQQIIGDTNPAQSTHWLKARADAGRTRMTESRHQDNPVIYRDGALTVAGAEYMAVLDNLTGVRRARLRDGLWVSAEGIIYDGFDPAIHVIDKFVPPDDWPRYWVVDFGYVNPFVLQRWAADPDGRLYLYAEQYHTKRLVEDHAKYLVDLLKSKPEPPPKSVICDHDAEDRATLERHLQRGTVAANKKVSAGIQAVAARFKVQGDGKPRLFLMRDAVQRRDPTLIDAKKPASTLEEVTGYVWENDTKETPTKADDHGMDAMRYLCAQLDLGPRVNVRWL